MNYIEFEIGGKLRGFKMGLGFLGDILKHYDTDLQGFVESVVKNPFHGMPQILFYAHKHQEIRKGKPFDITVHDVEDWLDEAEGGVNNKNVQLLIERMVEYLQKHMPVADEEEAKTEKKN